MELPRFAATPWHYYRIEFEARAAALGYWAVDFYDADGKQCYADTYAEVDPAADWHRQVSVAMARSTTATARVAFRTITTPFEVRSLSVTPVDHDSARNWADALYATLPSIPPLATVDWDLLPRTREILQSGGELRLIVLGDSTANDLFNGHPQLDIERDWPGAQVKLFHGIGPEKGCPGYQHGDCVERYVIAQRPDLVVIAGMSFGGDVDAVINVIDQVRQRLPDIDILVMTVSLIDGGRNSGTELAAFHAALRRQGGARRFGTADLRQPWAEFLATSPQPASWYHRDRHHAGDRGKQILARLFARLLAPC